MVSNAIDSPVKINFTLYFIWLLVLAQLQEQAVADPNKICDLICRCGEVFPRNMSAGVGEILILFLAFITGA